MKIKGKSIKSFKVGSAHDIFAKNRLLTRTVASLIGLILVSVVFFVILGLGARMTEAGDTSYIKNTLMKVAAMDFSFVRKYTVGRLQDFDNIQMDIKFEHLMRIHYLRERALEEGLITPEMKSEEFPAKLTLNGKTIDVKIGLTGLVAFPHLRDPERWSFEVKVKGDETFKGMKRFGMLRPSTRGYMTDWLGFELMKERDLIGLRVDYVHISINGKPIGIYYLEERFDKYLVENNRLREGIIFKLEDGFSAYQESKLLSDPGKRDLFLKLKVMWQDMMAGDLDPRFFFDMKKMAQAFALCDLMNNKHPLARQNIRYYFNPVTSRVEPIIREWERINMTEVSNLRLFIEKPVPLTRHEKFTNDPILKLIYDNLEFKKEYIREAEILSRKEFLDDMFAKNENKINALMNKVYRTWPFYRLHEYKLYENQDYIRSTLFPQENQLAAYINNVNQDFIQLSLYNLQYLPVEVSHVSWRDSILLFPKKMIVLDTKEKEQPHLYNFYIPGNIQLTENSMSDIKVNYKLHGLKSESRTIPVSIHADEYFVENRTEKQIAKGTYATFEFISSQGKDSAIYIPTGKWVISKDLVIPANRKLEIAAGAQLDFIKNSRLLSYSPVFMKGQEDSPIRIISSDSSCTGIYVIQADRQSHLTHVIFDDIVGSTSIDGMMQGAITFFESPVNLNFCTFSGGKDSKDYLHIRQSDFVINNSLFKDIKCNALGVNHCTGLLFNSSFAKISRKGISVINGNLTIQQVFLNNIGDQGLVAELNSRMTIRQADIRNANTGIVAQGDSEIRLFNALLEGNNIGIASYNGETGLTKSIVDAWHLKIIDAAIPYEIEPGCLMLLDGKPLGTGGKINVWDRMLKVIQ